MSITIIESKMSGILSKCLPIDRIIVIAL